MEKVNRWIFYILGMVVLAAGITLNTKTGLGVSPIISVAYCVSQIFELNFGDMTFVLYGIFVVVQLFLRERRERLATLLQFPLSLVFSRATWWTLSWRSPDSPSCTVCRPVALFPAGISRTSRRTVL